MRGAAVPSQQLGGGDGGEELQLQAVRIARFTFHLPASAHPMLATTRSVFEMFTRASVERRSKVHPVGWA